MSVAPAACYIAFFSLIRLKNGSLTHLIRSHGSVVESVLACEVERSGLIHTKDAWQKSRLSTIALR